MPRRNVSEDSKRFWRWVAAAVTLCAAISWMAIFFTTTPKLWGDSYFWHHAANLLAEGKGFILPNQYKIMNQTFQSADHPPVYIVYLAFFSLLRLNSEGAHQFATVLITLAAVPSFAIVARRLGGTTAGIVAAFVTAIHPVLWGWNKMIMSEPFAIVAVAWLLWAAIDWRQRVRENTARWTHAVRFGLIIGFGALTRSELLLLGALLAIVAMFTRPVLRTLLPLTIAGASTVLSLAPWVAYNLSRFEEPVYLSIGANGTLVATNCDVVYDGPWVGYWSIGCALRARDRGIEELEARGITNPDQSQIASQLGGYWREYMWENRTRVPKVMAIRIARAAGLYRPIQQMALDHYPEGRDKFVVYGAWGMYAALIPLSFIGARALRRNNRQLPLMLLPIGSAMFTVAVTFGNTRYRLAAEPTLILLGSLGIAAIGTATIRLWRAPDQSDGNPTSATTT